MKNRLKVNLLIPAMLFAASLAASAASYLVVPNYIDGSTNTVVVAGTNATVSSVSNASTNSYNLPGTVQSTNFYPAVFILSPTSINPIRNVPITISAAGAAQAVTFALAASADYIHWHTNWARFSITAGAGGAVLSTNIDTYGFPFVCLQAIESPSTPVTNMVLSASGKPSW